MTLGTLHCLKEELKELKFYAEKGVPILIEGKKDEEALQRLGINGNFIKISGSPLKLIEIAYLVAETASEAIILTDFDEKGEELANKLRKNIESLGCRVNTKIRYKLKAMTKRYIKDIENLPKYLDRLKFEICPYTSHNDYLLDFENGYNFQED
ncbi:TOPRIM domain protein [Methanothermus fervidus DSM 2088]|uniref:UPF0292 protein Mfer_0464 n=1 Tax=Methanothermus fervidus (strain ATCC 43054 / DSM 2088 / JCM 10308 / V24 S) TaxID=523846 RepID=E3GY82_METFV|nr:toprim domain-containing protein [Methanothermus fervidus]ADP77264.1 TOPRIM domain protein [Methanothermus fervidus DSM 2088]